MKAKLLLGATIAVASGLAMGLSAARAGEVVIDNFDDADTSVSNNWSWENWSNTTEIEADDTLDAGGSTGIGSLKMLCEFPNNPGGYSQCVITGVLGYTVDAESLYSAIECDLRLDPASYPRIDGVHYGQFEINLRNGPNWDWTQVGTIQLTSVNTNWTHLSFPIKAPADAVHRITLKLGENNLTNTVILNIDNLRWIENTNPVAPPTMSIQRSKPGLNLLAGTGGQYDRQNIAVASTAPSVTWVGATDPVSFSVTIADFPGTNYAGIDNHIYLVPDGITAPGTENSPDWNEPSVMLIQTAVGTDGTATMTFRYKTNYPNSNGAPTTTGGSQYFNSDPSVGPVGTLGSVSSPTPIGTWTVKLNTDTTITLTAPGGATTNLVMPAADAAQFSGNILFYTGVQPNQLANIGQAVILSGVKITQGSTTVEDHFTTAPLSTDNWVVNANNAADVQVVTPADPFWVSWTTPASNFGLQASPSLSSPTNWVDIAATPTLIGTQMRALINSTNVPSANQGFFRLLKPAQ